MSKKRETKVKPKTSPTVSRLQTAISRSTILPKKILIARESVERPSKTKKSGTG